MCANSLTICCEYRCQYCLNSVQFGPIFVYSPFSCPGHSYPIMYTFCCFASRTINIQLEDLINAQQSIKTKTTTLLPADWTIHAKSHYVFSCQGGFIQLSPARFGV